ncbi:hypothetical protein ABVK25_008060 [Lepraria finkii]|uniref:Uncharacterized protein n=1 Tax=Lepraria finkii TaxID=1340010 RepID=A0ABR4B418_9LECA
MLAAKFSVLWFLWLFAGITLGSVGYVVYIIFYNIKFHPFARTPGPFWVCASPLYALLHAYRGGLHLDVSRCHEKYGLVVRYSPNRLVFNSAEALRDRLLKTAAKKNLTTADIYRQGKNTQKSPCYAPYPYFPAVFNTHNCIDKEMHRRKRRIVSQGFSPAAMNASEPMILNHAK